MAPDTSELRDLSHNNSRCLRGTILCVLQHSFHSGSRPYAIPAGFFPAFVQAGRNLSQTAHPSPLYFFDGFGNSDGKTCLSYLDGL